MIMRAPTRPLDQDGACDDFTFYRIQRAVAPFVCAHLPSTSHLPGPDHAAELFDSLEATS